MASDAGLDFVLESGPTPRKPMIEAVAGGVAAFDADGDGLIDIYFANGADAGSLRKRSSSHWNRLYRNLGGLRFSDVTEAANVAGHGYSMGVAAADYDNDGDVDLFVAGYRANILYRNNGRGEFSDVTSEAGIVSSGWSVAAGWFDYDRDGALDLLVINYLDWDPADDRFCGDRGEGLRIYCSPTYWPGLPNTLYRNRGDGTFEDVSEPSGLSRHVGKGMSVAFGDFDLDGWVDAFVANDTEPDFLFRNLGNGTFEETGLLTGVALASDGAPISSMGVDFQDYDND
ncbi:MAG: VCBS repeat-containing protein, partial [Bryobacterales bacterium]|nr:VCBS repeat-containing protein [Bryobacterales bacterium]